MSKLKEKIEAAQIDLIKELGIDKLEKSQKEELLIQIGEILQQRIVLRIVEELPEEKQDEFKTILEKAEENPEQLDKYLEENIPGVEDMILEEIGEYKKGASDFMKQTLKNAGVAESKGEEKIEEVKEEVVETKEAVETPVKSVEPEVVPKPIEPVAEPKKEESEPVKKTQPVIELSPTDAVAEEKSAQSGIEQEQVEKEAQILEENEVENKEVAGEELDLSTEIEKMATKKSN